MKRLKELRVARALTQAQLAKQIGTTQQTVARWERGKATPSVQMLEAIAYALQTTISHFLGQRSPSQESEQEGEVNEGTFWGHLGLLLPTQKKTVWYPITDRTYSRLWSVVRNLDIDDDSNYWVLCETLNNRMLAFQPDLMERIWLLDDACDGPEGDWSSKFDIADYSGLSPAIYRAMDEWVDGAWGFADGDEEGRDRRQIVDSIIKKAHLDDTDKLHAFLHNTKLHSIAGRIFEVWMEPDELWRSINDLGLGFSRAFYVPGFGGAYESFFPTKNLVLVDAPLIDALEGRVSELAEYEKATPEPDSVPGLDA